jgi:hypothetical protein
MNAPALTLQGQVKALFRRGLRVFKANPSLRARVREVWLALRVLCLTYIPASRPTLLSLSSLQEMDKHASIPRKSFARIEYLLRKGRRQLDLAEHTHVRHVLTRGNDKGM